MRKTLKLSLTLVLAFVMLCAVAVIASAETTLIASGDIGKTEADNVVWEYTQDTATGKFTLTFSGTGKIAGFSTPSNSPIYPYRENIDYLVIENGITEIGQSACYGMKKVTSIVIPDSVQTIGRTAFRYCSGVTDFYMGAGVTKIDTDAFAPRTKAMKVHVKDLAAWCGINFVSNMSNPVTAGSRTMYMNGEAVTELVLPSSVTSIGKYAFYMNTGLSKVYLHDNITNIGFMAFATCSKLRTLEVDNCVFTAGNSAFQNCTYLRYVYINNIKSWFSNTWSSTSSNPLYNDIAYAYVNSDNYVYKGVAGRKAKMLVIPEGTEVLKKNAFYKRRDLSGVVIPATVTTIEKDPFAQCMKGLQSDGVTNDQFRNVYSVAGSAAETYVSSVSTRRFKELGVDLEFVDVTGVTLNQEDQELALGTSVTAKATITPSTATDKHIVWTSSDLDVARVSRGVVTAIGAGQATITGSTTDGSFYDSFVVTVPEIAVTGIELDVVEATLTMGHTLTITATVLPADATNTTVTWTTDSAAVATVSNGIVTPVGGGTTTIRAKAGNFEATCVVTVDVPTIDVTSVTLDVTAAVLAPAETLQLTATVLPADATDATVTWTSTNNGVATVVNGLVTAVADGETVIKAKAGNIEATCTVKVETPVVEYVPVEEIALDVEELDIAVDETYDFVVTFNPDSATDKSLYWESSNEDVAIIEDGKLTAIAEGFAIITVISLDNEDAYAECVVNVVPGIAVESVKLNKTSASVLVGDTIELVATVLPENAKNKNVSWTSSNEDVATVVDGVVTTVGAGVATITVTTEDGEFTATCKVIVSAGNELPALPWNK